MTRHPDSEGQARKAARRSAQSGFSLIELLIALVVMLFVMAAASQLIVSSFRVRAREDKRGEALADARRALDTMTHEIASAGYKLPSGLSLPANGIVSANSSSSRIRFVTNTGSTNTAAVNETGEDVMYALTTDSSGNSFITRYDMNSGASSILGNRIDNLTIRYYDQIVRYTTVNTTAAPCDISTTSAESTNRSNSTYVVISVCVTLPQVGTAGADGYQAASTVQMTSDVFLRNMSLINY